MSFTAPSRSRVGPALPLAGMIDVLFLLLIFFMTASVFREQELQMNVDLPAAESAQAAGPRAPIVITIQDDGGIYMGQQAYELPELQRTLRELADEFPNETVLIRGDREGKVGLLVRVIDMAYDAGLANVQLATTRTADDL